MRFFYRLIIGFPVTIILSALVVGPENIFQFFVLSIICTAGIGAIPWILVSFVVGLIIDLLTASAKRKGREIELDKKLAGEPADVIALVKYINTAREEKMDDGIIRLNLKENGWTNEMISRGFDMV